MMADSRPGWFPRLLARSATPDPVGRPTPPPRDPADARRVGALTTPFTARMLAGIDRGPVNAVCSPVSAQVALTMAGIGARGETRAQMEAVLGGSMEDLAESAATLAAILAEVGEARGPRPREDAADPATASLADGVWVQAGLGLEPSYREHLRTAFGVDVREVDFTDVEARERGRTAINDWVADATGDRIRELVPSGALSALDRLVLVNALHLRAAWTSVLEEQAGTFTTANGEALSLEVLRGRATGWFEDEHCRATALRCAGGELALALVQPVTDVSDVLDSWAATADSADSGEAGLAGLLAGLRSAPRPVDLTLPGFDIEWGDVLNGALGELGMADALGGGADFSGIAEAELFLSMVLQKAVITVDREGMEAAAATAVLSRAAAAVSTPRPLVLDAPFLVVAYELTTLAPLVVGWIGDPMQTR